MNRNFIFVFILLATLSIVYAIPLNKLHKRETVFVTCEPKENPPPLLSVKISPDPVHSLFPDVFTVSGQLEKDIPKDAELIGFFGDPKTNKIVDDHIFRTKICENSECPKGGTPFNLTLNIPEVPKLPDPYDIVVGVIKEKTIVLACAVAREIPT